MAEVRVEIRLANDGEHSLTVMLEPWTKELELPPGATWTVIATGDPAFPIYVDHAPDRISVSTFDSGPGAGLAVYDAAGRQLF